MKNKKYRGQYKCDFCLHYTDSWRTHKKHMKEAHGKIVKKKRKRKLTKRKDKEDILIEGQTYSWDKGRKQYELCDSGIVYDEHKEDPEIIEYGDRTFRVVCQNCYKPYRFQLNPTVENGIPLMLCTNCGLNIFKRNVDNVIKKKKLPQGINVEMFDDEPKYKVKNI